MTDDFSELQDGGALDASDTLDGSPGEDTLEAGVITPNRWSTAMKYGTTAEEQRDGESLDQLLAEEEPDTSVDPDAGANGARPAELGDDVADEDIEDVADEDVDGLLLDDGPDPRSGRLVAPDEGAHSRRETDLVASDVGIDGGAAGAEEAAVHTVEDDDTDIRSGD